MNITLDRLLALEAIVRTGSWCALPPRCTGCPLRSATWFEV